MAKQKTYIKPTSSNNTIRIISGTLRGRKIPILTEDGLRPTSDRTRETLFNWLQNKIINSHCIDLFAGSGALGFEAISRGAKNVTFLEKNSNSTNLLQHNIKKLNLTNCAKAYKTDALKWLLSCPPTEYDILFLDPPFGKKLIDKTLDILFSQSWISHKSWIYLEQEKKSAWPEFPKNWICYREKTSSQVKYGIFCYRNF